MVEQKCDACGNESIYACMGTQSIYLCRTCYNKIETGTMSIDYVVGIRNGEHEKIPNEG